MKHHTRTVTKMTMTLHRINRSKSELSTQISMKMIKLKRIKIKCCDVKVWLNSIRKSKFSLLFLDFHIKLILKLISGSHLKNLNWWCSEPTTSSATTLNQIENENETQNDNQNGINKNENSSEQNDDMWVSR